MVWKQPCPAESRRGAASLSSSYKLFMKRNKHAAMSHVGFRDRKRREVNNSSLLFAVEKTKAVGRLFRKHIIVPV